MRKKYDVFISSKSEDYYIAEKIYAFLSQQGLAVFLASKELQKIGEAQYGEAIDDALDKSHHLIVVASSLDNIKSKWVQHEWSTFSNDLKSGYRQGNLLTVLSDSFELRTLPASLRHQQSFYVSNYQKNLLDYLGNHRNDDDFKLLYNEEKFCALLDNANMGNPNLPFVFAVEDSFYIAGRGIVATGKIQSGKIKYGDELEVVGYGEKQPTTCGGIEMFGKIVNEASTGDSVGLLLRGLNKSNVFTGKVVAQPSYLSIGNVFSCDCYFFNEKRCDYKISSNQQLTFYIRTAVITGRLELPADIDYVKPGDYLPAKVVLTNSIALNQELVFAIRMNDVTIGTGIVKFVL